MQSYLWPVGLVVLSNIFYQISAKGIPANLDPFASLTLVYVIAAVVSLVLFYLLGNGDGIGIIKEYAKLNWAPFVLGVVIVGLEVGWILAYKMGCPVSTGYIMASVALAILLIPIGYFLYKEGITWNKLVGIAICLVGLVFLNIK